MKLDIGISSEVSGARVLYDTKINSDDRTRAYGDIKDDHSNYHINDDSQGDCKNSSRSCYSSSRRIIHNENNGNIEDSVNVYIDKDNITKGCDDHDLKKISYDDDNIKKIIYDNDKVNKDNDKIPNLSDVNLRNEKKRKDPKILSIASTLWGFGFIVE